MNGCDQFGEIIGAYVLGQASQQECVDFERHLDTCVSCQQDIKQRRAVLAALTPETPTAAESRRILRSVRNRIVYETAELKVRKTRFVFRLVAAASVASLLFVSGIILGRRIAEPRTQVKIVTRTVVKSDASPQVVSKRDAIQPHHQAEKHVVPTQPPVVKVIYQYRHRITTQQHAKIESVDPTPTIEPVQTVAKVIAPMPLGVDDTRLAIIGN